MANSFNEYLKRGETTWADIVSRVIGELYQDDRRMGYEAHDAIYAMRFVPSSPILRNAGLAAPMMTSCFVLDVEDDIASIMDSLKNTVMIQKYGGGVGINFSKIRPEGSLVRSTGGLASGPTSFARFWDAAMEVIRQGGWRKGAMMGVLDWQHPDLDLWLSAKEVEGILTNFNLSVGLTRGTPDYIIERIAQRMWVNGEPGVLYLDNINDANPYDVPLRATNPCGEQPLPPFGACCLGSIDLRKMLRWEEGIAHFDWDLFRETIRIGMEVLNRVIDRNWWPIPETGEFARRWRPVGLGVMGLADTMILLGIPYASPEGRWFVESLTSYMKSWSRGFSQDNVTTLSMPPTGTTGMLAGVIGTGIEPVFSLNFTKQVDSGEYDFPVLPLIAKAAARYDYELTAMDRYVILDTGSAQGTALPDGFKEVLLTATEMGPGDHLEIVERAQRYVDSAISKTVNVPNNTTPEQIAQYIRWGGEHGLKGITFYRTGSRDVEALVSCATGTCDF